MTKQNDLLSQIKQLKHLNREKDATIQEQKKLIDHYEEISRINYRVIKISDEQKKGLRILQNEKKKVRDQKKEERQLQYFK